jgi:AcrR family transcriptional regulator
MIGGAGDHLDASTPPDPAPRRVRVTPTVGKPGGRSGRRPTRTGRRPGNPDTRQVILDAARATFAASGYDRASIRRIAAAAGVDPALVHHYFGTKDELFMATIEMPIDLPAMLSGVGAAGRDGIGVRIATMILSVWESPLGAGLAAWLRTALADERRARLIREFLVGKVIGPFAASLGIPEQERTRRVGLVMTQILGLIVGRYLLFLEPVVSLTPGQLTASVGATIQRYLTGPLPPVPELEPLPPPTRSGRRAG